MTGTGGFTTVFGRGLVEELPAFLPRPYLVVTMDDLWPRFASILEGYGFGGVHLVRSLELTDLERAVDALPAIASMPTSGRRTSSSSMTTRRGDSRTSSKGTSSG